MAKAVSAAQALGLGESPDGTGNGYTGYRSAMSSSTNTLELTGGGELEGGSSGWLTKQNGRGNALDDAEEPPPQPKGFKRFSKRTSKSGLAAVF